MQFVKQKWFSKKFTKRSKTIKLGLNNLYIFPTIYGLYWIFTIIVLYILGTIYFWGAAILGVVYLLSGIPLLRESSVKNAKLLLRTSVLYLPLLLVIILIDLNYSL